MISEWKAAEENSIVAEIEKAKTLTQVNGIEKNLNLDSDAAPRLKKLCEHQRILIRGSRGPRAGPGASP